MAASVRIEDEAFGDGRYLHLGQLLGTNHYDALGRMAWLWRQCTQKQTYILTTGLISAIVDPQLVIAADLGEPVEGGIRIKGTKGRIEWLAKCRKSAKKGGKKTREKWEAERLAGRQAVGPSSGHAPGRPNGLGSGSAPTPALTTTPSLTLPFSSPEFKQAWEEWEQHRRELRKPLKPTARKQQLKKLADMGEQRAIAALHHSTANGWQGIFEPEHRGQNNHRPGTVRDQILESAEQFLNRGGPNDPR